jgi:hypothetical protein
MRWTASILTTVLCACWSGTKGGTAAPVAAQPAGVGSLADADAGSDAGSVTEEGNGGAADGSTANAGRAADAGAADGGTTTAMIPHPDPIGPDDAPPKPAPDLMCPPQPPAAPAHFPGPCTIVRFHPYVQPTAAVDTWRTQRRWTGGIRTGETVEYWSSDFPSSTSGVFNRSVVDWTLTAQNRPLRAIATDQYVYGLTEGGRLAWAGYTDFDYGPESRALGSSNTYWVASWSTPATQFAYQDTYAGDSLGRIFLADRTGVMAEMTAALDAVFLFEPVPITDLSHSQSFTLHPNGVVATYTISISSASMSRRTVQSFDERGVLQQTQQMGTVRFGTVQTTTSTYSYDGDRLIAIDTTLPSHTQYLYDASGNNVERVTTGGAGEHYSAVFDGANNLVCEKTDYSSGVAAEVLHYDYGCFTTH